VLTDGSSAEPMKLDYVSTPTEEEIEAEVAKMPPQPPGSLPWVAWYAPDGHGYLTTWVGKTREVIVAPIADRFSYSPKSRVPPGAHVYELPEGMKHDDALAAANRLEGLLFIVFTTMPKGEPLP